MTRTYGSKWQEFAQLLSYRGGDVRCTPVPDAEVYYCAVHPSLYGDIAKRIMENRNPTVPPKLILEKPFGTDQASAAELNTSLRQHFRENQLYRIDHFLGKEPVQNLMAFRFANTVFEPLWHRNHVDHIQITAAERLTVGSRGAYYDKAGVLRDVIQNHLLQLLALVTMEIPTTLDNIREEKLKVLRSIPTIEGEALQHTLQGQYDTYRDEPDVDPGSMNPTFGCVRVEIPTWRWKGVPCYLRAGKGMAEKTTRIVIQFKPVPTDLFQNSRPNRLVIKIQPEESIRLHFATKVPGKRAVRDKNLLFQYNEELPNAYEKLLLDVFNGDRSLFTGSDEIDESWRIVDPVQDHWARSPLYRYELGSWGPPMSNELLTRDGREWS
jgi:glucose-6-phosphate 1-dehydrogenase